ncbi:glycosyltransferase family 4 protein [Streptomyces mayteni]
MLTALSRLLPPERLVVIPAHVPAGHPGHDPQWNARVVKSLSATGAEIMPIADGHRFNDSPRGRDMLCRLVAVETNGVAARSGRCLLIGLDVPTLGLAQYVAQGVDMLLVPRSTAALACPEDRPLIRWERTGLLSAVSRGGRIAAISEHMRRHLKTAYGIPSRSIIDLPNGLVPDEGSIERQAHLPLPPRARAGFLLAMGRAVPDKGFDDLLHALALLRQQRVRLPHLVLVAASPTPDADPYSESLAGLIREYGLNATLIGRFSPAVRGWLHSPALRAVVVPSRVEPFGRIPLEAFAAQAGPVVATRAGGLTQTVLDGVTGFTAEPGHPESLATAIQRALTVMPREREELVSAGAALLARRHDYLATIRVALTQCAPWAITEAW